MRVTVDDGRCRGHGMCLTICPEVFDLTDDGYAIADPEEVSAGLEDAVQDAIENCPERAISEI